jgi:hypothetical protein
MSEVQDLVARAEELVEHAAEVVKDKVEADATQLRIAVRRLELFIEAHVQPEPAPAPVADADDDEDELESLTRDELNDHAESVGVESPDKLPNKGAVIDAIRDVQE